MGMYDGFEAGTLGAMFGVATEMWAKKLRFEPLTRRPYMYPVMAAFFGYSFAMGDKYWGIFKDQSVHQIMVRDKMARQYQVDAASAGLTADE